MLEFLDPVLDFIVKTEVPKQIDSIDYKGLFGNGWFMVPYISIILWNLYKKEINSIIVIVLFTGSWAFFGTPYMKETLAQDTIPLGKILPLIAGACCVLGIILYRMLFKSD